MSASGFESTFPWESVPVVQEAIVPPRTAAQERVAKKLEDCLFIMVAPRGDGTHAVDSKQVPGRESHGAVGRMVSCGRWRKPGKPRQGVEANIL